VAERHVRTCVCSAVVGSVACRVTGSGSHAGVCAGMAVHTQWYGQRGGVRCAVVVGCVRCVCAGVCSVCRGSVVCVEGGVGGVCEG